MPAAGTGSPGWSEPRATVLAEEMYEERRRLDLEDVKAELEPYDD